LIYALRMMIMVLYESLDQIRLMLCGKDKISHTTTLEVEEGLGPFVHVTMQFDDGIHKLLL